MADTTPTSAAKPAAARKARAKAKPRAKAATTAAPKPAKRKARAPKSNTAVAKSRFNAALDEARAGAAALGAEARQRAGLYRDQATTRGGDWAGEAKTMASDLARDGKAKAGQLAREGKTAASGALASLGKTVGDNAGVIDDNLGKPYGDYARSASQSLHRTATALDNKSVEELGEDAREMVRKSPAAAVGLAALAGFFLARLFRR